MKFGDIPEELLDYVLGDCYELGDYTLRDELKKYGEDIIVAKWHYKKKCLHWFLAWTKNYAMCMIDTAFNDKTILGLERDPPKRFLKPKKTK